MNNIGVFIDADNISAQHASAVMTHLRTIGNVSFVRSYGNWKSKTKGWKEFQNQFGVQAFHRFNLVTNKNAADMALTVDATASLYGSEVFNTMVVMSSDCDFEPLVTHARSRGKYIVGCGSRQTPKPYVDQCQAFVFMEDEKISITVMNDHVAH